MFKITDSNTLTFTCDVRTFGTQDNRPPPCNGSGAGSGAGSIQSGVARRSTFNDHSESFLEQSKQGNFYYQKRFLEHYVHKRSRL